MLNPFLDLETTVAQAGYELTGVDGWTLPEGLRLGSTLLPRWILERQAEAGRAGVFSRSPETMDPLLYRRFAALQLDEEKVIDFVNEWGYLSQSRPVDVLEPVQREDPTSPPIAYAETLEMWFSQSAKLAYAIGVHQVIQAGDYGWLACRLRFKPEGRHGGRLSRASWEFRTHTEREDADTTYVTRHAGLRDKWQTVWDVDAPWELVVAATARERDDARRVAATWLDNQITRELRLAMGYGVRFGGDDEGNSRGFRVCPLDLLSLMWWQFARSVSSGTEERPCRECDRWFALTPKDRDRKFFCSEGCKTKNFRNRKRQAAELFATGDHTVDGIASVVGSDAGTVRKWLGLQPAGGE